MKNILIILIIALSSIAIFYSCSSSTGPENKYKDPREMTWTCDTLQYEDWPQNQMTNILAFSSKDIFIYGFCSNTYGEVYHYDGNNWQIFNIAKYINGLDIKHIISLSRTSFIGVGEKSGYKGKVFRGDGTNWYLTAENIQVGGLLTIAGNKPDNVYAAGRNGDVLFYDGVKWNQDNIKIIPESGRSFLINSSAIFKDTVHFLGVMSGLTKTVYYHIKGNYKNWAVTDSMVLINPTSITKFGSFNISVTNDNRMFTMGYEGIWEYNGKGWERVFTTQRALFSTAYIKSDYIAATGHYGTVYFYDGVTWTQLTKFEQGNEDTAYEAVWGDGKEMFIVGYLPGAWPQKTIVWHGK